MVTQLVERQSTTQNKSPMPEASESTSNFRWGLLAVLLCSTLLYVAFAVYWNKFSRAEVFFGEAAREMIAHNNFVTPLYHNKPFFDKPIFVYWLIVAMYKTFGISHMVARIPSIVAALGTVALTATVTRWLATTKKDAAGLVSAICLSSGFMFFSFAYLCMSDMFLVLFDTITMSLLYYGLHDQRKRTMWWMLAATSIGFAFVTKGPVGIVLPVIAFGLYLAVTRQLSTVKIHHVVFGALIAGLIAVPWFYAAYQANGTWALAYFFIRENLQRYAGATYDTHKPVWFMVTSLIVGFLPWSVFLPGALADFASKAKEGLTAPSMRPKLYLWIWLAVVTGFFSFSRGKCDYYVLPIYPAAAALVALYLTEQQRRAPQILLMVLSGLCLVGGIFSPILLSQFSTHNGFESWWIMPTAMAICGGAGLITAIGKRQAYSMACLFAAICFAGSGFAAQMLPPINQSQSLDVYSQAMRATPASMRVGVHTALGHWVDELTFTVERDPVELSDDKTIADFFLQGKGMALIPEQQFDEALAHSPALKGLKLHILDKRDVSSHPLTPGYVLKRKGNLYDTTLLLVTN